MELMLGNIREEIWAKDISENTEDRSVMGSLISTHNTAVQGLSSHMEDNIRNVFFYVLALIACLQF